MTSRFAPSPCESSDCAERVTSTTSKPRWISNMEITNRELTLLNFYRASELQGGLILGRLVEHVRDPDLILRLTEHSSEEIMHAQLWTKTIIAVGGRPRPTSDTYQSRYAAAIGTPSSLVEVLALTQVFERGVYRHFVRHLRRPGTHPLVQATLR